MARLNKLHLVILTAGTFLSTVIKPTAARLAQNTTAIRIWDQDLFGYSYTGCFTSDTSSSSALDEGVNVTAVGRMTPPACLHACHFSDRFLEGDRQPHRVEYMKHIQENKGNDSECAKNENQDDNKDDAFVQEYRHDRKHHDHDDDKQYQYAGLTYNSDLDVSVCMCSDGLATASENVTDAKCDTPCDGNATWSCGGPDLIVLYNLTQLDEHGNPVAAAGANGVSIGALVGAFLVTLWSL